MPTSLSGGGCTFADDPALSCASILPMWSAVVDPRVLTACPIAPDGAGARLFDMTRDAARSLSGVGCVHMIVDRGSEPVRLDVTGASTVRAPMSLCFQLIDDGRFEQQISALRAFRQDAVTTPRHRQLAERLIALRAIDARQSGLSLREIADALFGPGEWPGEGEHRKSRVRRLIALGRQMITAGPRAILARPLLS